MIANTVLNEMHWLCSSLQLARWFGFSECLAFPLVSPCPVFVGKDKQWIVIVADEKLSGS